MVTRFFLAGVLLLLAALPGTARSADFNPLRPVDTSSPRATMQGFVAAMDEAYAGFKNILQEYAGSDRLFLSPSERQRQRELLSGPASKAVKALDLSGIPPILQSSIGPERAIQLKEILDRIDLPAFDAIPDQAGIAGSLTKRWRLPGTEIDIARVENGPRAGEYLVTAATVDRLPEFYNRVKSLPYKPGPAAQLSELYRRVSAGAATTNYEAYLSSPIGLERIIPTRWMLQLPFWAKARLGGAALWQWLGLAVGLTICGMFLYGVHRLARPDAQPLDDEPGPAWRAALTPSAVIIVLAVAVPILWPILHISGAALEILTFLQTAALFLCAAWLTVLLAGLLAECIVASEHLRRRSLDSQLIRLGMRFVGISVAVGLVIQGAYELGFPAYSVLAGLGVGGLAVALAARDSLANLLGSLLIMLEKPFRVGQLVTLGAVQGTVEDVGFRSTRIRTPDSSLVSIPNNTVVNATIENMSLRSTRRQRFLIQVTYGTSRTKIEQFCAAIRSLILDHPRINNRNLNVRFNDFGESSLNVLVIFHIEAEDYATESAVREEVLLQIMDLAERLEVDFAFPTRTLIIDIPREMQRSVLGTQLTAARGE